MEITIFGLGRMGMQIAKRLHKNFYMAQPKPHYENYSVFAWNRSEGPIEEYKKFGGFASSNISEVIVENSSERIFWLMLPHEIVEEFLQTQLMPYLKPGDIVIDGGNSNYKESIKRGAALNKKGIVFYDCGTSGGVWGYENGFALMIGGPKEQWPLVEPIFKVLSSGDNYGLVGKNGAGHFVKMVHNGIEYGMMEAIAEGYGVLEASDFQLDLNQVTKIYQTGSVVRSWLIDLCRNIFEHENVAATLGKIEASGEGEWTVLAAKELGVDARVIEDSLKVRQESQETKNQQKFSNKLVALMRKQFGGHEIKK
jgi:6-phosphogluconate dehydrogenase